MIKKLFPGVVAAIVVAALGAFAAEHVSLFVAGLSGLDAGDKNARHLVSGISLAVLIGLLIKNTVNVPDALRPGVAWVLKTGLRIGIVLLGFKLALGETGMISGKALPVVACCITAALVVVTFFNNRLKLSPKLGALIAVGTSICGVTAIVATGPAIQADENETSYAVACVTIFGLIALFTYPWLAHSVFGLDPVVAGIFLGTSIHDTSQVAGAGMIYQEAFSAPTALQAATVTKLMRNMSMAVLIPVIAARFSTAATTDKSGSDGSRVSLRQIKEAVPGFVIAFLVAIALRTIGDYLFSTPDGTAPLWKQFLQGTEWLSKWALASALAGIGLNTDLAKLRGLGIKPLLVGLVAAVVVGMVSFTVLSLL